MSHCVIVVIVSRSVKGRFLRIRIYIFQESFSDSHSSMGLGRYCQVVVSDV